MWNLSFKKKEIFQNVFSKIINQIKGEKIFGREKFFEVEKHFWWWKTFLRVKNIFEG